MTGISPFFVMIGFKVLVVTGHMDLFRVTGIVLCLWFAVSFTKN